jgi:hypothetical protein
MLRREVIYFLWALYCVVALGCDPERTVRQTWSVRITDVLTGNPVAGTTVKIKCDFDLDVAESRRLERMSGEMRAVLRKRWEEAAWQSAVTDNGGQAVFTWDITEVDQTRGPTPPRRRDEVTERPYFVKLNAGKDSEEEVRLRMKPGEVAKGTSYAVTVVKIEKPEYVENP